MNKTKTPGPWRVGDAGYTVFGPPNGKPSPTVVALVRNKADAPLLAAAPRLLAALQLVVEHASGVTGTLTGGDWTIIRAAIQEAGA